MKRIYLLTFLILLFVSLSWADNIIPVRTDVSGFPTWTDTSVAGTTYLQLLVAGANTITPAMNFDNYTSETLNYKARTYGGTNAVENTITISISTNNGTDWTVWGTVLPASSTMTSQAQIDLSSYSGTQVKIKFSVAGTSNSIGAGIDDITIAGTPFSPSITVTPTSLSGFTYVYGSGPSTPEKTFTVSGANLTNDISIAASTNYEISKTSGSGYTSPLTFTQSGGTVSETTVYVRLKANLAIGTYNSETITASSTGATDKTVTCSGSVTTPPPPNAPVATDATNIGRNAFKATWNTVSGASSYKLDVYTKSAGVMATDLFISEYVEGSSNNKYIEIFNGTGSPVSLADYKLQLYANGASTVTNDVTLSGTLENGECIVYKNSSAVLILPDGVTAISNGAVNYNGDDAVALFKISSNSFVDIFGRIGEDPGTEWGTSPLWTVNTTLVRKSSVNGGVTTNPGSGFPTLATEWDYYAQDTATYLGSHTMAGGASTSYVSGYEDSSVGNVLEYDVTGLNPYTTYYYVVRAVGDYGTSINSNEKSATTAAILPGIPAVISGFNVESTIELYYDNTLTLSDPSIPNLPNAGTLIDPKVIVFSADSGTTDIIVTVGAGTWYGVAYYGGTWHQGSPYPQVGAGDITFADVPFGAKGDVPVVIGEGGDPTLPVELSSFTATTTAQNYVVLNWTTQSETNLSGYYLYRNSINNIDTAYMLPSLIAATNTSSETNYSFVDQEVVTGGTYYYWLESIELNNESSMHGPISVILTNGNDITPPVIPSMTELRGIYPNPFNPMTIVSYNIAKTANVTIDVYNVKGEKVRNLVNASKNVGSHQVAWNGNDENGKSCTSGIYYIKMIAGKYVTTQKAVLTK